MKNGRLERFGKGLEKVWKRFGKGLEKVWKRFGKGLEKVWKKKNWKGGNENRISRLFWLLESLEFSGHVDFLESLEFGGHVDFC